MKLSIFRDTWELNEPFSTAQSTVSHIETVTACLNTDGVCGRGEALGVDYLGEDADSMVAQIEPLTSVIEHAATEMDFSAIDRILPAGGARNAIDCALWDLKCKQTGQRIWQLVNYPAGPVRTVYTLSMDSAEAMAEQARAHRHFPALKLKIGPQDTADKIRAIHQAHPEASLVVDANQTWSLPLMDAVADDLAACNVAMLEQPLPMGGDQGLAGLVYPVPLCADESCQSSVELETVAQRYQMVNIKLDKSGGLSEALRMARWCTSHQIGLMVGNMLGSSLAMAPAWLIAQHCRYVDLDGPLWQKTDRSHPIQYQGADMSPPDPRLWG